MHLRGWHLHLCIGSLQALRAVIAAVACSPAAVSSAGVATPPLNTQSCVDPSFWSELASRKLDQYKLSEAPVEITGGCRVYHAGVSVTYLFVGAEVVAEQQPGIAHILHALTHTRHLPRRATRGANAPQSVPCRRAPDRVATHRGAQPAAGPWKLV